jgi:hypothetical protein
VSDIVRLMWARFKIISATAGDAQGRIIVTAFYYTVLAPFAIGTRLTSDPLRLRTTEGWLARAPVDSRLEDARRQG